MAKPAVNKDALQFTHKDGYTSLFLTLKKNESQADGVKRLASRGWSIPKQIVVKGQYIYPK